MIEKPQNIPFLLPADVIDMREEARGNFFYARAANGASRHDPHTGDIPEYPSYQPNKNVGPARVCDFIPST